MWLLGAIINSQPYIYVPRYILFEQIKNVPQNPLTFMF